MIQKIGKTVFLLLLLSIFVYSCNKIYVKSNFRQTYKDVNTIIHEDPVHSSFFKMHFKNGDVGVMDNWDVSAVNDSITGSGSLYDFNRNVIQKGPLSFAINDIAIIETNQLEAIKSKHKSKVSTLAILTGVNVILDIVCVTNPKACFGSCPTFYLEDGSNIHNAIAEGFSSSISPSLERNDIDALQYRTNLPEFNLTMKNEAFETHMLNELFVYAVPKEKSSNIYQDNQGIFYSCGAIYTSSNSNVDDLAIGKLVNKVDNLEYFSKTDSDDLSAKEEIILNFENLPDTELGLVLNFRQTLLTTFLLYSGISYMGDEVGDYFAKIETNEKVKQLLGNPFKRLGKIKISVWDTNGKKWKYVEELYETGPIAKNMILARLKEIRSEKGALKVKIEMTKGLWRIDYAALTAIHSIVEPVKLYPNHITIKDGEEYNLSTIIHDDDSYLISFPGNEFEFSFALPKQKKDLEYELFLSAKGYYLEWIRQQWLKDKDLVKLKKMLSGNDKVWSELALEYKMVEDEMETVFWNSKYSNIQ